MVRRSSPAPNLAEQMVEAYAVNDRMYQLILEHLDPRAWKALPAGKRTRSIADMVAHVHNVRCKWLRLSAPHLKRPVLLKRARCTQKQAASAMAQSAARCCEMLADALATWRPTSRGVDVRDSGPAFLRDGWARPWAPGAAMFAYMLSHDRITAARYVWSRTSSAILCPSPPGRASGNGKSCGKSAATNFPGLKPALDRKRYFRHSLSSIPLDRRTHAFNSSREHRLVSFWEVAPNLKSISVEIRRADIHFYCDAAIATAVPQMYFL